MDNEIYLDELFHENGDVTVTRAALIEPKDVFGNVVANILRKKIQLRQTLYKSATEALRERKVLHTDTINLSREDIDGIATALHGKLIGKLTGETLAYSQARDQLYAELREHFGAIRKISNSNAAAKEAFQVLFIERENEEKAVHLVRLMASVISSELIERYFSDDSSLNDSLNDNDELAKPLDENDSPDYSE